MISLETVSKKQHGMRGMTLAIACVLLLSSAENLLACESSGPRQLTDLLTNREFSGAEEYLRQWEQREGRFAELGFYQAMAMLAKAKASSGQPGEQLRQQALAKLLDWIAQASVSHGKPASTATMGMAKAFAARIYLEQERWFKAYRFGKAARNELRDLVERKPDSEDAYLVLGLYEFYTGSVPAGLRWLMALIDLSGNKEKGLRYLERAVAHAPIAAPEAARILVYELPLIAPKVCTYIPLLVDVRRQYPNNLLFTLRLQHVYRECGYPLKALEENRRARKSFRTHQWLKRKLDWEALHIYRDLGDLEAIESLSVQFRDSSQEWLMAKAGALDVQGKHRQAGAVYRQAKVEENHEPFSGFTKASTRYKPPPKITNAKQISIHQPCSDNSNDSGRSRKSRQRTLTNDKRN